jgi:hypothetical protein
MPELAVRLDYKKGPYSAEEGDFASAGTASVVYANRLLQGVATVSAGQNGYGRALVADSVDTNFGDRGGSLLYALEVLHNDGPFTHPDDYQKLNAVLRYSEGYANNGFNVSLMAYRADWNSTDQIPLRAVQEGEIGRNDAIDPSDGGKSHRYSLSGGLATHHRRQRVQGQRLHHRQPVGPVLQLHLLHGRSGARRPVRAAGQARHQRPECEPQLAPAHRHRQQRDHHRGTTAKR